MRVKQSKTQIECQRTSPETKLENLENMNKQR